MAMMSKQGWDVCHGREVDARRCKVETNERVFSKYVLTPADRLISQFTLRPSAVCGSKPVTSCLRAR